MALPWRKRRDDEEPDDEFDEFDVDDDPAGDTGENVIPLHSGERPSDIVLRKTGSIERDEPGEIELGRTREVAPWAPPEHLWASRVQEISGRPILPPIEHVAAAAKWWGATLGRDALWFLTHPWVPVRNELRPIAQGMRVTWRAWKDWETVADMGAVEASLPKETPGLAKLAADREARRAGRRKLSALVLILLGVGVFLGYLWYPGWLLLAGILAVLALDVIGRWNPDPEHAPPPKRRTMLEEGAPLGSLTSTIMERFAEDGLRVEPAGRMTVHPGGEYRLDINHEDAIEPKHLRSLERHINAPDTSVRCIGTRVSGVSQLRLPTRDHLAVMPERPWADTGSRSIQDPAPLWLRSDGDRSAPNLSAVHIDLVGTTGAGKSEAVQEMISFFGECGDVYPVFGDLTRGPLGPLNKRVLRKVAYTVHELDALLDWALEKVEERHLILHRLAESDDDDDAPVEWDLSWGPEIKIILDEYSFVAVNNGKNDTLDLHGKVEAIMRVGRKVKVCVIRASQRSGNADLGSTVAQALVGLKILLACTERDTTTMLSTQHRDQGWTPHLLRPAVKGDARDAGKCFVWGPGHRDPEIHRFHRPRPPGEIKRTDRRRFEDGLPNLDGTPPGERPAVLLSDVQAAVERVFESRRGYAWLPTQLILEELAKEGITVTSGELGDELGNCGSRADWEGRQIRGYRWTDVAKALGLAAD